MCMLGLCLPSSTSNLSVLAACLSLATQPSPPRSAIALGLKVKIQFLPGLWRNLQAVCCIYGPQKLWQKRPSLCLLHLWAFKPPVPASQRVMHLLVHRWTRHVRSDSDCRVGGFDAPVLIVENVESSDKHRCLYMLDAVDIFLPRDSSSICPSIVAELRLTVCSSPTLVVPCACLSPPSSSPSSSPGQTTSLSRPTRLSTLNWMDLQGSSRHQHRETACLWTFTQTMRLASGGASSPDEHTSRTGLMSARSPSQEVVGASMPALTAVGMSPVRRVEHEAGFQAHHRAQQAHVKTQRETSHGQHQQIASCCASPFQEAGSS